MFLKYLLLPLLASLSFYATAADKLPVVASFSIMGDLVRAIGGDKITVTTLVGPDGDAHVYQPSPQDGKTLSKARLLVVNGLGYEGWISRLAQASQYKGLTVVASDQIQPQQRDSALGKQGHDHGKLDPHAWQDPTLVRQYVHNIASGLAKADPANIAYYQQRAADYSQSLAGLEAWADSNVNSIPPAKRRVITSHDAFGYLGRRFRITFLAPQGMNTDAEASAKSVGMLIRQARQSGIKAIFVENISNPRLIEQISRETGVQPGVKLYSDALSRPDGPAGDYLSMMRYNIHALVNGMKQN